MAHIPFSILPPPGSLDTLFLSSHVLPPLRFFNVTVPKIVPCCILPSIQKAKPRPLVNILPHQCRRPEGDLNLRIHVNKFWSLKLWMVFYLGCHLGKKIHVHNWYQCLPFAYPCVIFLVFDWLLSLVSHFNQRNDFTTNHDGRGQPRKAWTSVKKHAEGSGKN